MTTQSLDSPASGEPRPAYTLRSLHDFRRWRKGRPFPAGLLIVLAGIELWLAPLSAIGNMIHEGVGGVSAVFIGALMLMFGLSVWFSPGYRVFAGIASILLGLIALPATNIGGFLVGTLLSLIGGGLAAAWVPRPGWQAPTWRQRRADAQVAASPAAPASGPAPEPVPAHIESVLDDSISAAPAWDYEAGQASAYPYTDPLPASPEGVDASAGPQD
jgi:hypothetical protein